MLAGRSSVEDFDFLIRQTEHTLMQCLRASKREAYETTEESAQRAMQMTMKAQKAQKQHAIFSAWYRTTMRGKIAEIEHYWKLQVLKFLLELECILIFIGLNKIIYAAFGSGEETVVGKQINSSHRINVKQ